MYFTTLMSNISKTSLNFWFLLYCYVYASIMLYGWITYKYIFMLHYLTSIFGFSAFFWRARIVLCIYVACYLDSCRYNNNQKHVIMLHRMYYLLCKRLGVHIIHVHGIKAPPVKIKTPKRKNRTFLFIEKVKVERKYTDVLHECIYL